MIPSAFSFYKPDNLQKAINLIANFGDESRVIAGGHSLIPVMKQRLTDIKHLIDLSGIDELKGIKIKGSSISIGAMTTQVELITNAELFKVAPVIREASLQIADPQVRNLGTIGGNVANGDPANDMPGLTKPIKYWDVMNEPEFKMFFKGSKEDFVEIFNFSSKVIKEKQPDAVIVMAGAAGMFPESKKYWEVVLPKIKDNFDIANIHHISGPDGQCDKQLWVDEFAALLKSVNVDKPIWLTEAMTCGPPVKAWVNAFLNGAELIIDVGVNAPGRKMSKKGRKKLNEFIAEYDGFTSIKRISEKKIEFTYKDGSSKTLEF